ncbi:MAG: hypothetical protein ACRYF1_00120 [Janthinobacterium lividum]
MRSQIETHPLMLDPPIELSREDKRTIIALGLVSMLIAVLTLLGLRCVFHHVEWMAAALTASLD